MDISVPKSVVEYSVGGASPEVDYLGQMLADAARAKGQSVESLRIAGKEFEAYFIGNLMRIMRETVQEGLFKNRDVKNFYYFYDMEIGRMAAQAGGIGLGRMIEEYGRQQNLAGTSNSPSSSDPTLPKKEPMR